MIMSNTDFCKLNELYLHMLNMELGSELYSEILWDLCLV
jgi:hypothetical protein